MKTIKTIAVSALIAFFLTGCSSTLEKFGLTDTQRDSIRALDASAELANQIAARFCDGGNLKRVNVGTFTVDATCQNGTYVSLPHKTRY